MNLTELSVNDFMERLASGDPTPGGGSVAALAGALSASLSAMVANLTLGREKFKDGEEEMTKLLKNADRLREEFLSLIEEDASAFDGYMAARRLPKETEEQKGFRAGAMEEAAKRSTAAPLKTLESCVIAAELAKVAEELGNPNVKSDAGVAALMAMAAAHSAFYNVCINLPSIKDREYAGKCMERSDDAMAHVAILTKEVEARMRA